MGFELHMYMCISVSLVYVVNISSMWCANLGALKILATLISFTISCIVMFIDTCMHTVLVSLYLYFRTVKVCHVTARCSLMAAC